MLIPTVVKLSTALMGGANFALLYWVATTNQENHFRIVRTSSCIMSADRESDQTASVQSSSSKRPPTRSQPSRHVSRPNVCLFWFPKDRTTGVGETKKVVRDTGSLSIYQWVTVSWNAEDVPGLILATGASRPAVSPALADIDMNTLPDFTPGQTFWEGVAEQDETTAETQTGDHGNSDEPGEREEEPAPKKRKKKQLKDGETGSPKKAVLSLGGRMIQVPANKVDNWKTAEDGDVVIAQYSKRTVEGRLMKIGSSKETAPTFNMDCDDTTVPEIEAFTKKKEKESFTVLARGSPAPQTRAHTTPENNNTDNAQTSTEDDTPSHLAPEQPTPQQSSPAIFDDEADKRTPNDPKRSLDFGCTLQDVLETLANDTLETVQRQVSEMTGKMTEMTCKMTEMANKMTEMGSKLLSLETRFDRSVQSSTSGTQHTSSATQSSLSSDSSSPTEPSPAATSSHLPAAASSSSPAAAATSLPAAATSPPTAAAAASSPLSHAQPENTTSDDTVYFGLDLDALRRKCLNNEAKFAKKLAAQIFSRDEVMAKNCSGTKGKHAHDPERLGRIRKTTQEYHQLTDLAMVAKWKECIKSIDMLGREQNRKERIKQMRQQKENNPPGV
ncbi:polycomb group protein Asx-like isoform X1 [Branchiostoma lanceolatum]|uniref:polycomb group protein Asx-like isoform X1 n=2 Tax=Branchiostoma lanceolatum TaxID=7740 RepID=UPI003453E2FF